jgi:hypothetical protein
MSKHLFPGKTVNFILACDVVSRLFLENITELSTVNTTWTKEYADELFSRVERITGECRWLFLSV